MQKMFEILGSAAAIGLMIFWFCAALMLWAIPVLAGLALWRWLLG